MTGVTAGPPELYAAWLRCSLPDIDTGPRLDGLWRACGRSHQQFWIDLAAAQQPQPAPGLREALRTLVADWREGSKYRVTDTGDEITEGIAVSGCADSLAAILDQHPDAL